MKDKIFKKGSIQYGKGNVPTIDKKPRAELREYRNCGLVPSCKIHGALLCFKHNIWRCIECGWAVKYERHAG